MSILDNPFVVTGLALSMVGSLAGNVSRIFSYEVAKDAGLSSSQTQQVAHDLTAFGKLAEQKQKVGAGDGGCDSLTAVYRANASLFSEYGMNVDQLIAQSQCASASAPVTQSAPAM